MPRRYKSVAEQNRADKRKWPKTSLRPAVIDVLEVILRMRHMPDHEIYLLIEEAITHLPEYRRAYDLLAEMPDGLPKPPE